MNEKSIDKLFSDEDKKEIELIQKIRRNVLKYIGIKNFINMVRDLIDESESFEFTSATKRKFINENTPIFTIRKIKPDKITSKDKIYLDREINKIVEEINKEILNKTTREILKFIENDVEIKKVYESLTKELDNDIINNFLWTTVFEIKVSLTDNIIYLRYCI